MRIRIINVFICAFLRNQWNPTIHSLDSPTIPLPSCSHGEGPQPTVGHAPGIRCAAGMPGGGLPIARLLLAEGGANVQRIRQRLHGQPRVRLAGPRNAARRVSSGNSVRQTSVIHIHLETIPFHSLPLLAFTFWTHIQCRPKYGITERRDGYRGVMLLVVRSFSPSDVGTYHCVSTNSLGRAEGTLRLYGAYTQSLLRHLSFTGFNLFCLSRYYITIFNVFPFFQVGWLRASDQTVLALQGRVVTHNARISVMHQDMHT